MPNSVAADEIAKQVNEDLAARLKDAGIALIAAQTTHDRDWIAVPNSEPKENGLWLIRAMVSNRDRDSGWWSLSESIVKTRYSERPWIALLILTPKQGTWMRGNVFLKTARHYPGQNYSLWGQMAEAGTRYSSIDQLAGQLKLEIS